MGGWKMFYVHCDAVDPNKQHELGRLLLVQLALERVKPIVTSQWLVD